MHKNFVIALDGKWKEVNLGVEILNSPKDSSHLEKIRAKYKNAYRPWNKEEEGKLVQNFKSGISIKELSEIFSRQTGGIKSRLIKLGLISE